MHGILTAGMLAASTVQGRTAVMAEWLGDAPANIKLCNAMVKWVLGAMLLTLLGQYCAPQAMQ